MTDEQRAELLELVREREAAYMAFEARKMMNVAHDCETRERQEMAYHEAEVRLWKAQAALEAAKIRMAYA